MMTRKDFEQIAREFGWAFHRSNLRFNVATGNVVGDGSRQYLVGVDQMMGTMRIAFMENNPRFNSALFMERVNHYADRADEIGNQIFKE